MDNLISRQAAIDGILHLMPPNPNLDDGSAEQLNFSAWKCALTCAEASIKMMPSAQPQHEVRFSDADHVWIDGKQYISLQRFGEAVKDAQPKHTEERTETHACDCISRQDAIDEAYDLIINNEVYRVVQVETLMGLPSAEPQLDTCPIYGGMCGYPSNLCYECPRHEGAKERPQWWTEGLQPFAQPQRWIPVSERLPENGHYYLWCSNGGNVQSDYYWDGFENGQKYGYTIVAWMPLPEAYKGEEE